MIRQIKSSMTDSTTAIVVENFPVTKDDVEMINSQVKKK